MKTSKNISLYILIILISSVIPEKIWAKTESVFEAAKPGYIYSFPKDHSAHFNFASEWWYYTGNLKEIKGNHQFGYQLTFFRIGLDRENSIYAAHFALSDISNEKFYFFQRVNRPILKMAGAEETLIWNKNWHCHIIEKGQKHSLKASEGDIKLSLDLINRDQKPVIQGLPSEGISRKGNCPTCASHYYSYPNLSAEGSISVRGKEYKVSGNSWMDHEFGSSQLQENQVGWDWFSLHLQDGASLMLYQIRQKDGEKSPFSNGTYISKDGQQIHIQAKDFSLKPLAFWKSKFSKASYPLHWNIKIPSLKLNLNIEPKIKNQELLAKESTGVNYWEGAIKVISADNKKAIGDGYLELTGYDGSLNKKF